MALGTATVDVRAGHDGRPVMCDLIHFVGDGAYPTGGTAAFSTFAKAAVARGALTVVAVVSQDCGGYTAVYDETNDKLKVYYNNNDGGADGPAIEVPNDTNLAGVTFNVLVLSV